MTLLNDLLSNILTLNLSDEVSSKKRGVHIEFDIYVLSLGGYLCWWTISNSVILLCLPNAQRNLFPN